MTGAWITGRQWIEAKHSPRASIHCRSLLFLRGVLLTRGRAVDRERSLQALLDEPGAHLDGWLAAEQSSPSDPTLLPS
jgi:hypothetical protein